MAAILAGFGYPPRRDEEHGELDDGLLFFNVSLMRGLGLHGSLAGAELLEESGTARGLPACTPSATCTPARTGRTEGGRASIAGELYAIPIETLLRVIEGEPPGLYRGPVEFSTGGWCRRSSPTKPQPNSIPRSRRRRLAGNKYRAGVVNCAYGGPWEKFNERPQPDDRALELGLCSPAVYLRMSSRCRRVRSVGWWKGELPIRRTVGRGSI